MFLTEAQNGSSSSTAGDSHSGGYRRVGIDHFLGAEEAAKYGTPMAFKAVREATHEERAAEWRFLLPFAVAMGLVARARWMAAYNPESLLAGAIVRKGPNSVVAANMHDGPPTTGPELYVPLSSEPNAVTPIPADDLDADTLVDVSQGGLEDEVDEKIIEDLLKTALQLKPVSPVPTENSTSTVPVSDGTCDIDTNDFMKMPTQSAAVVDNADKKKKAEAHDFALPELDSFVGNVETC